MARARQHVELGQGRALADDIRDLVRVAGELIAQRDLLGELPMRTADTSGSSRVRLYGLVVSACAFARWRPTLQLREVVALLLVTWFLRA